MGRSLAIYGSVMVDARPARRAVSFTRQLSVVILRGAKRVMLREVAVRRIHKPHGCCDYTQHDAAGMFNAY